MSSRGAVKNSESRPTQQKKKQEPIKEQSETKIAQPTQSTMDQKKLNKQLAKKRKARQRWWATTGKKLVGAFVIIAVITGVIVGIVLGTSGGASENSNGGGGSSTAKPTLMDIGSTSCIPCQQLQPVLENLRSDYGNKVNVKFYDAWNTTTGANMATKYKVTNIPTLIFLDANGKEVARMTGYQSYDVIVAKFKALGWV